MYDLLYFIRMFIYIVTIPLLIISIIIKNKCINKNNFIISIFMLVYLTLELFFINKLVNVGLDFLSILLKSVVTSILLVISIIVNKIKLSNVIDEKSNYFIKNYSKIFIILVLLITTIAFLYELFIINKAKLIMVYLDRSFMFASDPVQISVSDNSVKKFSLKHNLVTKDNKENKFIYYYFKDNENQEINLDSSEDTELKNVDMNIVNKIYDDILSKYHNEIDINLESIVMIENTNYYIIEYYSRDTRSNNKVLYNNGEYITEFEVSGDLEKVYILK